MKTVTTEAEVDASGWLSIHAPAPAGTPPGRVEAMVILQPSTNLSQQPAMVMPPTVEQLQLRRRWLDELVRRGGLSKVIPDPVQWQRDIREDRSLPGRD